LLQCPVFEVFFGGARGGGKTDGMLGDWILHANKCEHAIGLMIRRTRIELVETHIVVSNAPARRGTGGPQLICVVLDCWNVSAKPRVPAWISMAGERQRKKPRSWRSTRPRL
jgi:hypothetical protein